MMYRTLFHTYWPQWSDFEKSVLIVVTVAVMFLIFCLYKSGWTKRRCAAFCVLAFYLCYVFGSTVFARAPRKDYRYELELFWSYREVMDNPDSPLKREILLNYVLLAPYGFLMPVTAGGGNKERRKGTGFMVIVTGCLVSCMIEGMQLSLKRGLFELDDILNNTIGVVGGYVVYCVFSSFTRNRQV